MQTLSIPEWINEAATAMDLNLILIFDVTILDNMPDCLCRASMVLWEKRLDVFQSIVRNLKPPDSGSGNHAMLC